MNARLSAMPHGLFVAITGSALFAGSGTDSLSDFARRYPAQLSDRSSGQLACPAPGNAAGFFVAITGSALFAGSGTDFLSDFARRYPTQLSQHSFEQFV
jgi:hypothetical protein